MKGEEIKGRLLPLIEAKAAEGEARLASLPAEKRTAMASVMDRMRRGLEWLRSEASPAYWMDVENMDPLAILKDATPSQ